MAFNSGNKIGRRYWGLIPMLDTVIARVNTLGGNQTKNFTFTYRHGCYIGDVETPGVGDNSDEGEVEIPVVETELEEEELEISYMEPEGNVELPGVDMEGQDALPKVIDIYDPEIPQDPSLIAPKTALEVPADPDGLTQVSTLAT